MTVMDVAVYAKLVGERNILLLDYSCADEPNWKSVQQQLIARLSTEESWLVIVSDKVLKTKEIEVEIFKPYGFDLDPVVYQWINPQKAISKKENLLVSTTMFVMVARKPRKLGAIDAGLAGVLNLPGARGNSWVVEDMSSKEWRPCEVKKGKSKKVVPVKVPLHPPALFWQRLFTTILELTPKQPFTLTAVEVDSWEAALALSTLGICTTLCYANRQKLHCEALAEHWNTKGIKRTEPDSFKDLVGLEGTKLLVAVHKGEGLGKRKAIGGQRIVKKDESNVGEGDEDSGDNDDREQSVPLARDLDLGLDGDEGINESDLEGDATTSNQHLFGKSLHPEAQKKDTDKAEKEIDSQDETEAQAAIPNSLKRNVTAADLDASVASAVALGSRKRRAPQAAAAKSPRVFMPFLHPYESRPLLAWFFMECTATCGRACLAPGLAQCPVLPG
ncbi:hypothetical protein DFS34DRAFT_650486 [Phlyctochytrium arcticum]|nr:hypothetical protein DFS34DRAFT_650486 [Phlyctochytrium arcticum]